MCILPLLIAIFPSYLEKAVAKCKLGHGTVFRLYYTITPLQTLAMVTGVRYPPPHPNSQSTKSPQTGRNESEPALALGEVNNLREKCRGGGSTIRRGLLPSCRHGGSPSNGDDSIDQSNSAENNNKCPRHHQSPPRAALDKSGQNVVTNNNCNRSLDNNSCLADVEGYCSDSSKDEPLIALKRVRKPRKAATKSCRADVEGYCSDCSDSSNDEPLITLKILPKKRKAATISSRKKRFCGAYAKKKSPNDPVGVPKVLASLLTEDEDIRYSQTYSEIFRLFKAGDKKQAASLILGDIKTSIPELPEDRARGLADHILDAIVGSFPCHHM